MIMNMRNNSLIVIYRKVIEFIKKQGIKSWVAGYLLVIFVFAVFYNFMPDTCWGDVKIHNIVDAIYFSVVTITSLGFGDIHPSGDVWVRLLVAIESIGGILIIGFFLNYVAQQQAIRLDKQNSEAEERKKADAALSKLKTYQQVLHPVLERYLLGVIMMVTPFRERINKKVDAFQYDFKFRFSDMSDLYLQTLLMNSDFYEPAVNAHFRNQDIAFNELRSFVTSVDLSYWPELEELIYCFIRKHHEFQFQDVIINNGRRPWGEDGKMRDEISKLIKMTDGEPKFSPGDMIAPYVLLYYHVKENINIIKGIYTLMELASKKRSI